MIGMGEGIAGLRGDGWVWDSPGAELVGCDFDVYSLFGVVDVVIRVPFVGVGWYVAYLGNDVVVDILDAVGCVVWE